MKCSEDDGPCTNCLHCADLPSEKCPWCGKQRSEEEMRPNTEPVCSYCGLREDSPLRDAANSVYQILLGMIHPHRKRAEEYMKECLEGLREELE